MRRVTVGKVVQEPVQLTLHRTQLIRPDIIASSGRARSTLWHGVTPRHGAPFRSPRGPERPGRAELAQRVGHEAHRRSSGSDSTLNAHHRLSRSRR